MRRRNRVRTRGANDHATDVAEQTTNLAPAGTEKQSAISVRNGDIWLERVTLEKEPVQMHVVHKTEENSEEGGMTMFQVGDRSARQPIQVPIEINR